MAFLWWVLFWCHHAQQTLHAEQISQSSPWTNPAVEGMPTASPTSPSISSSSRSDTTVSPSAPYPVTYTQAFSQTYSSESHSSPTDFPPFSSSIPTPSFSFSTTPPSSESEQTDEEGSKAALNFLHSGDLFLLSEANCSKSYELTDLQDPPAETLLFHIRRPLDSLLHATNFLNMIFQASDMRESSIRDDMEWYHALVRSLAGGNLHTRRALLSFSTHPMSSKPQLLLQATKKGHEILLQDLSSNFHHGRHRVNWESWVSFQTNPSLSKAILLNDLRSLDTPKWIRGDSYIVDHSNVRWSKPFLECDGGHFLPGWMISLSTAFYGLKPDLSPEFK